MPGLTKAQKVIVRELQNDSETTLEALSPMAALSASAVSKTIKALEDSKVIVGYKAVIDRKKVGLDVLAVMLVAMKATALKDLDRFAAEMKAMENVIEFARIAGEYDFFLKLVTRDTDHHYELARRIADFDGVGKTTTFMVLKQHESKDLPIA